MTGMRGTPCPYLYQEIHMRTGNAEFYCRKNSTQDCIIGSWCPIRGNPRTHIVPEEEGYFIHEPEA